MEESHDDVGLLVLSQIGNPFPCRLPDVLNLQSATKVTYEYNADSGIWATIGNVAIVIDEGQLTQQGIEFIATILSDIAPDIAFKPEYVKPDAKILSIEKQ